MAKREFGIIFGCFVLLSMSADGFVPTPYLCSRGTSIVHGKCPLVPVLQSIYSSPHSTVARLTMSSSELLRPNGKNTILVAGSTGRVGSLVVDEIVKRFPNSKVRAVVRSEAGIEELKDKIETDPGRVEAVVCDLSSRKDLMVAMEGVNQVVWCASGLSPPRGSILSKLAFVAKFKLKSLFGRQLDVRGPRIMCELLAEQPPPPLSTREEGTTTRVKSSSSSSFPLPPEVEVPRFVMLSSAAVTRPTWSEEKKAQYPEAANIPIVQLNPLGVLGLKLKGEDNVRRSGVPYTIVRSCGITTNQTAGQAFQVSTGDTAVGLIHPADLSAALATMLGIPDAAGKTVELRTEGSSGLFGRGTKSVLTQQMAAVALDSHADVGS